MFILDLQPNLKHWLDQQNLLTLDARSLVQSSCFSTLNGKMLLLPNISSPSKLLVPTKSQCVSNSREITVVSRLGKRKSCKAVSKRFRRVRGGLFKRRRPGKVHKQRKKSSWRRFRLRGNVLVKRKTHLILLNKMMYKY